METLASIHIDVEHWNEVRREIGALREQFEHMFGENNDLRDRIAKARTILCGLDSDQMSPGVFACLIEAIKTLTLEE
jgi:hypothetical protein